MTNRILRAYLKRDAGLYPIVTLTGPRQSGKTTLAKQTFPRHQYVSLEESDNRLFAAQDPRGFLARFDRPLILDEVQRAPDLFSYLQAAADKDNSPGRFVLTGSHNFLLMNRISQTLAGRCAVLHLLPFSRAELENYPQDDPVHPPALFANSSSRLDFWRIVRTGFYPRIHAQNIPPEVWIPDYLRTYIERDIRSLVNLGDLDAFERFLALCAGRAGQLLVYSALASDAGVSVDTARRWISVLKASFIVFTLQPHHRNFNKRMIKCPKLFFYDTGLLCHLLRVQNTRQLIVHPLRGPVFENYVIAEIAKAYLHHRRQPPIYFWRDRAGREIDLLIEDAHLLYPVEIKSGQTVSRDMLDNLVWWRRTAGSSAGQGVLIYGGNDIYEREGILVRPWFSI